MCDNMTIFDMTEKFCQEVIGITRTKVTALSDDERDWLIGVLREEITEFEYASELEDKLDALIDLMFFAAGGFTRMGIPPDAAQSMFRVVFEANMTKEKGRKKRDVEHELDAVKPANWQAPEKRIKELLDKLKAREA